MTDEEKAEEYVNSNGFGSDYNNIDSNEANHKEGDMVKQYKKKPIKEAFKDGDWGFGIGPHKGCSQVFTGSSGDFQPFDFLNDYDPAHFRIATDKEIDGAKNK